MKIELEISEENESTDAPWWLLIDPAPIRQMLELVAGCGEIPEDDNIISTIAMSSIEGPYFSRKSAEDYLKARAYEYSKETIVWCSSGYWSSQYKNAIREARNKEGK